MRNTSCAHVRKSHVRTLKQERIRGMLRKGCAARLRRATKKGRNRRAHEGLRLRLLCRFCGIATSKQKIIPPYCGKNTAKIEGAPSFDEIYGNPDNAKIEPFKGS